MSNLSSNLPAFNVLKPFYNDPDKTIADHPTFKKLRAWRNEKALEHNSPAYRFIADYQIKKLIELNAVIGPIDLEDVQEVLNAEQRLYSNGGEDILQCVVTF